ncbi:MAG: crossover junction endodeoxyribonuclease RuvC [Armatimonadota bacterium]
MGIDPGLQCTGYGVVDFSDDGYVLLDAGVVRTDAEAALQDRLQCLFEGILEVMEEYHPEVATVEKLYSHYEHPHTAILMGHARGTIYLAAAEANVAIEAYEATLVKKSLTGHGRASKEQVGRMVCRMLSLAERPTPVDITDALALALCHGRPMDRTDRSLHPQIEQAMEETRQRRSNFPGRHSR